MSLIKDVFFDLDRTLWDFDKNSEGALRIIYKENNLKNFNVSFEGFISVYREINAQFWKAYGEGRIDKTQLRNGRFTNTLRKFEIEDPKKGQEMNDRYLEISPYQTHLFPSTKEVLNQLKNDDYRLHIITNGFKEVQFIKMKNSGIFHFFDDILCSEEIGKSKPHPLVFQGALSRTKAKANQSIMIGDDIKTDIIGAENAGIRGVLFDPHKKYVENSNIERVEHLTEIPPLILGV